MSLLDMNCACSGTVTFESLKIQDFFFTNRLVLFCLWVFVFLVCDVHHVYLFNMHWQTLNVHIAEKLSTLAGVWSSLRDEVHVVNCIRCDLFSSMQVSDIFFVQVHN